ncbi:uncharacterized protein LOC126264314 [Aethina tumida]|uniref:uncharacterized protein LOC126264314 n=1 Tax=Aethina tumida TaxID=116153 RepID=UPI002147E1D5|nr:uncharacterized protein LOC126264314 [Aethina tumida]
MRNIHSFITAKDNGLLSNKVNFFDKKSKNDVYRTFSLPAEEVYFDIFYACFAAQMKGFVVMQFSYYYLRLHEKGTFESEINLLRKQNNKFFKEILHEFSNNIQFHSHYELWNDTIPASDKLGITYDVISKLLQGFIQNEESLSDKNSCWKNCDDFTVTKVKNFKGTKCDKKSCNGKVLNCQFISNTLKICPSNKNSLRRYESINNMGSTSLCPNSQCSAQYFRHFLVKCDYCFCICDGTDKYSDRYISLLPVFANVTANKVVTGVRLVKKNRVFFIQIQEGELGTYGAISNRNWVPVEDVNVTNRSFKNNIHYITLNSNRRSLNLKPKILKDNYVVTGIKFEFVHNQIQLNVRGTFYNASNGQLMENKQIWSEPAQVGNELILDKPDVPTKDRLIISNKDLRKRTDKGNNFVKFTHSDIEKDVAQTTIPYIDTQEVTSTFGLLQGVGLIHKGNKGFGGFIAPLLINTNPNSLLKQFLKDTKNDYE